MATDSERHGPRWLPRFSLRPWEGADRPYATLLNALTRDRISAEAVALERNATSRQAPGDIEQNESEIAEEELDTARRELKNFRAALTDVQTRGGADGRGEVPYDSADPVQNELADVIVQYLVRPGYAEGRTEERESGHYIYYLRVDWAALDRLAASLGIALPSRTAPSA